MGFSDLRDVKVCRCCLPFHSRRQRLHLCKTGWSRMGVDEGSSTSWGLASRVKVQKFEQILTKCARGNWRHWSRLKRGDADRSRKSDRAELQVTHCRVRC